jgi:hypothetical protein
VISDCELTPATIAAALMWMMAIDERSSGDIGRSISSSKTVTTTTTTTTTSPCCALIISSAYTEGSFSRHRSLPHLKPRLEVSAAYRSVAVVVG